MMINREAYEKRYQLMFDFVIVLDLSLFSDFNLYKQKDHKRTACLCLFKSTGISGTYPLWSPSYVEVLKIIVVLYQDSPDLMLT